ncbi:DUF1049 domain-containing protein [Geminocystis sp. GBBB08]|uniref:DUF1049 domain-containing protein n=1 Tax=Geminocystis sp. GBBB08 TaxID=2604140 RepID=UPI0027E2D924|nr:DUF1049 domain-containing protein [Geminocystis sp. GBBB08]MBL1211000.1 DUF1049 domain-containing protein [Geminocystis sp. GBBB08]
MTIFKQIIISLIVGFWINLIAVFSIQNITLVSIKFFWLESIKIPLGLLFAFALSLGFIIGAIIPIFFNKNKYQKKTYKSNQTNKNNNQFNRNFEEEKDPLFDWE